MIAQTEIFEVGRKNFTVNVEKVGHFYAVCAKIPGLVTTGKTTKAAVDRFMYFSEPFFNDFIINLPFRNAEKCVSGCRTPMIRNPSRNQKKMCSQKRKKHTSPQVGRLSPASLPREQSRL